MRPTFFAMIISGAFLFSACGENKQKSAGRSELKLMDKKEAQSNILTEEEKADGWKLLFNGENFEGWRGYRRDDVPGAWTIEDNAMKIVASADDEEDVKDRGDILYNQQFKNFELHFEWKVAKGANSGVFYLAREIENLPIWRSAPEYQVLDNENYHDALMGKDGNRKSASLYDVIPANPQNSKGWGEWNTGAIIINDGAVVHMQNGEVVLEYQLWTPGWKEMIANSKFDGLTEILNAGGDNRMGYIGLQDHGDDVWFRNIKMKEIK
jgi:hypothetical protein